MILLMLMRGAKGCSATIFSRITAILGGMSPVREPDAISEMRGASRAWILRGISVCVSK